MTGPQSGSPLAPFTADWVGGDISGLRALAVTLHDCAAEINEITATLNQQVAQLTGGDQGTALGAGLPAGTRTGHGGCPAG